MVVKRFTVLHLEWRWEISSIVIDDFSRVFYRLSRIITLICLVFDLSLDGCTKEKNMSFFITSCFNV